MRVEGKPELTVRVKSTIHVLRDAARHVGQIILPILSWACAKDIHSKKITIFVTLVLHKGNEGSGNDTETIATHSCPRTHSEIFFCHVSEAERKWIWKVTTLLNRCYGNRLATKTPLLGNILIYSNYGSEIRNFILQSCSNRIRKWHGAH